VGPEHSWLKDTGRVRYESVVDEEALSAFNLLSLLEGIIPALESSHAVARAMVEAARLPATSNVIVNLSGRGDKDLGIVSRFQRGTSGGKDKLA
jgi:tryptophan synthase beta chain